MCHNSMVVTLGISIKVNVHFAIKTLISINKEDVSMMKIIVPKEIKEVFALNV